ncbi:MAG TPA: YcdB/YcdC domain-containing protein [Clostridia bacterium]|nr:YcdB/YcdC domain-containing protein [Clostridia bacterium]
MKRIISIIILTAILFSMLLTGPVSAAEDSKVDLKKAIEIAKTAFGFDAKDHDFNSSYSEATTGRKLWYLNWNSTIAGKGSSISVTVDASTGEIISMNKWEDSIVPAKRIPKYTREEALKVAEELLKKLHPDKLKDTELLDEYRNNLFRPVYSNDIYSFYFMRKIDGINFQDNGIQIQVDKNTLMVRNFNLDWDTVTPVPDSRKAISAAAAKKLYEEKLGLELAYQMIYPDPTGDPELILVYTEKNSNRPIDAITGEIINQSYYGPMYGIQEKAAASISADSRAYVPTPQEQKVIDDSSKYISKEKAIEALMKYITVDSKYKMDNSSLYGGYRSENATWNFSWSYTDKDKNTYSYIYGAVDAVTGEVKNFSISSSEDERKPDSTPKFTKEQCRDIAEKFLKEIQPAKFSASEYREQYYQTYMDLKNVSSYNMNFIRKENGVSVPFNNLNVTVSAYTGRVTSFYMNWQNLDFPDAKGVISLEDAYRTLYAKHDLMLKYIRLYDYNKYNENITIKLAYMLDNLYGMIDAKSGQFIDYNGKPVKEEALVTFTDIKGHKYENDIKLLIELGIIDSAESKFNPDSKIQQKYFVKLLIKATQPEYYPIPYAVSESSDDSYYERAIMQNILSKKDRNPEAVVTKIEASKMIVRALGIGFVADLGNIFNLDVKDAASITPENKGYAAIAAALELVDTSAGSYGPAAELTKAETAGMLVRFLKVEKTPADSQTSDVQVIMPMMK